MKQLKHTSSIEWPLEDITDDSSSKLASEPALCKRTTFSTASKWDIYKVLRDVTFLFKSTAAYRKQKGEWENLQINYYKKRKNMEGKDSTNWMKPTKNVADKSNGIGYLTYTPYHERPKKNDRASSHLLDVHSVQTMMLQQYCKVNQPAEQAPLGNCSLQLCYLSSIYLLYLYYQTDK